MSGSCELTSSKETSWIFNVGDLVGIAPTRLHSYDYDGYYYPGMTYKKDVNRLSGAVGIVIEVYSKYGYFSDRYYRIKWSDNKAFSNERHEDLFLISRRPKHNKD